MDSAATTRGARILVAVIVLWGLLLHGCFFLSAGALWRDEANSIQQARLASWEAVWDSLQFDSFPILYPALLRVWSAHPGTAGDRGLRLFGLITGLAVLVSVWLVARLIGSPNPFIAMALLAVDPLLIFEGDGIRPYGVSMLWLLWTFGLLGRQLERPSAAVLSAATLTSVLAVQASYTNAFFIGVMTLCAAAVSVHRGPRQPTWSLFVPALAAAVSLVPYVGPLQRAGSWLAIARSEVDWPLFFENFIRSYSVFFPILWGVFILWALLVFLGRVRRGDRDRPLVSRTAAYTLAVALFGAAIQVALVEILRVPPFPRYLLPIMAFGALLCETALGRVAFRFRAAAVALALVCTMGPAWSRMRLRHTNVDLAAKVLERAAQPADLIVISPWFLHTSFQRYYHGPNEWISVPVLEHHPMMRYDLIQRAMLEGETGNAASGRIHEALKRGGSIWLVSQRAWTNLERQQAPEKAAAPAIPTGSDYVRFRSLWERDVEYQLSACCTYDEWELPGAGSVWAEEELLVTRWQERRHQGSLEAWPAPGR